MNKHTYHTPAMSVVSLETETIIAESGDVKSVQSGETRIIYGGAGGGKSARAPRHTGTNWEEEW